MKNNFVSKIILWGLPILLFSGIFLSVFPIKNPKKNLNEIHIAIPFTFNFNLDPVINNYINLQPLFSCIYSTLFKLDPQMKPYSFLLESVETRGKTVTFQLKENARYSDGTPITASDIVACIEASLGNITSPNAIYKVIVGGDEFFQHKTPHCTGIKILSPKSFEIQFKYEKVEYEYYFSTTILSILPQERNRNNRIFSGAYQVTDMRENSREILVKLKKNPYYLGNKGTIDMIQLHFYRQHDDFDRTIMMGEPDMFLYNRRVEMPRSRHKYNYFKTPTYGGIYFILNAVKGPFKDKQLRTFFKLYILSRDFFKEDDWQVVSPSRLVLPYSLQGYFLFNQMTPGPFEKYMPQQPVKIKCVNPQSGIRATFFPLLKKKLKKYNLDLDLKWDSIEKIDHLERKGDIDLTMLYFLIDTPLSSYFYETLFTPGHELNRIGYTVPEALQLLNDFRQETDELKKLKILSQLEEIAQEEAFVIPLANPLSILGYKDHLKNVKVDRSLNIYFEDIHVEKRH